MTKRLHLHPFMGQSMEVLHFFNFKKGELDIVFPYAIELSYGGQFKVTTKVKKIEINKTIDPAIFACQSLKSS